MTTCYESEMILPGTMSTIAWTASGPKQITDMDRARKTVYFLFTPGSSFDEVAIKFAEMVDGEDDELAEDAMHHQENEQENMPVFSLTGTMIKY